MTEKYNLTHIKIMFLILTNVTSLQIIMLACSMLPPKKVNESLSVLILFKNISDGSFNLRPKL